MKLNKCTLIRLSVSLNPKQPWLAAVTNQQVKIYNYETQKLQHCLDIGKGKTLLCHGNYYIILIIHFVACEGKTTALFAPDGK